MSSCKILFFLLFALCVLCGKCEDLYKQAGGEVTMRCVVPEKSNIEWRFNDALIFSIQGKSGTMRKGYIPLSNKAKLHGNTLTITKLESGDSGLYSCRETGDKYRLHIVSIFVKPGPVLLQSSDAELHCNIAGSTDTEVQWLRPPDNEDYSGRNQIIHLKSVTSKEEGQWTCSVKGLKLSVTLTVVARLQTKDVEVPEGGDIELPCSLPRPVSQRVVGGTWKADHLPRVSFPTLKNTEDKGLHWNGENSAEVTFTSGQLSTSYNVTLRNVKPSDKGTYVCTVEFEGGVKLSAEMNLTVTSKTKGLTNSARLLEAPDVLLNPDEDPSAIVGDVETVSVCSGPEVSSDCASHTESSTCVLPEPTQTGTKGDRNEEDVKTVYKCFLLKQIEALDVDIKYKKLNMRKLELEIQKLEKDASGAFIMKP